MAGQNLIWQNQTTGSVVQWVMFGTALFRSVPLQGLALSAATKIVTLANFDNVRRRGTALPRCAEGLVGPNTNKDFDGDIKDDIVVYRPSTGTWDVLQSATNYTTSTQVQWGDSLDQAVPGDYDGDGKDGCRGVPPLDRQLVHPAVEYGRRV